MVIGWMLVMVFNLHPVRACTSVIVSGRVTKDGRPMIFKHRDTQSLQNLSMVFQGPKYRYLGVVNAEDLTPVNVWGGHNEVGFAIINTVAYNLNGDGKDTDSDGIVMRKALGLCATLQDFERLLDTLKKPMDLNSNFGVMDARGGCAYYETGNYGYVKFDANDPAVAPDGYLMRTNFGFTGDHQFDQGVERYAAISEFMSVASHEGQLEAEYLITRISRYMKHGLTKINMFDYEPETKSDTTFFHFADYITRYSSASVLLVQGVRPEENPRNTVSWTIMGWPLTTVAMPLVLLPSGKLPSVVTNDGTGHSWLCEEGLRLKSKAFSLKRGNKESYCNLSVLVNWEGSGILQEILWMEFEVMYEGEQALESLRTKPDGDQEVEAYYNWVDAYVKEQYKELF